MEGRAHQRQAKFLQNFFRFFREGRPGFQFIDHEPRLEAVVDIFDALNNQADADRGPEVQRGGDHRDQPQICHE